MLGDFASLMCKYYRGSDAYESYITSPSVIWNAKHEVSGLR
ncbi:hypothetical protein [Piscirickettsia salmonis]|nr:hypothetical protein [Piscirickettsia salmonis]